MGLNNLGWEEILLLAVIGLIIFGPDRLPKAAQDLGRILKQLRAMANSASNDLRAELGPEMADLDLRSLHPRRFVENALFGDDDADGRTGGSAETSRPAQVALDDNETPPYDEDAT